MMDYSRTLSLSFTYEDPLNLNVPLNYSSHQPPTEQYVEMQKRQHEDLREHERATRATAIGRRKMALGST